jgi:TetR/AcrR family transcriptional regulator, transcriptional repressor for nem operon
MNDTKEHIVLIASKLFLSKSFKEVTMKELVDKTGLSKGAFYHYFQSKEDLFLEVLKFFFTDVMHHAYENYSKESFYKFFHDYANEVKRISTEYLAKFKGDTSESDFNFNYFTLAFDALKLFPQFKEQMVIGQEQELEIWTDTIKRARENGEIKSIMTDEQLAHTFVYLGDGVAMHMILKGVSMHEMVSPFLELWEKLYEQIKT